jgi:hypothetical protein
VTPKEGERGEPGARLARDPNGMRTARMGRPSLSGEDARDDTLEGKAGAGRAVRGELMRAPGRPEERDRSGRRRTRPLVLPSRKSSLSPSLTNWRGGQQQTSRGGQSSSTIRDQSKAKRYGRLTRLRSRLARAGSNAPRARRQTQRRRCSGRLSAAGPLGGPS